VVITFNQQLAPFNTGPAARIQYQATRGRGRGWGRREPNLV